MANFEKDYARVQEILSHKTILKNERLELLKIYQAPYHKTGKIEGFTSCDSSCNNCSFCEKIRCAVKDNILAICNYCYDDEQEKRWVNVKNRHSLNLQIMSSVLFEIDELATIPLTEFVRFNSSGDIENVVHARNYIRIIKAHNYIHSALFAKNTAPVVFATDIEGKPKNCVYVQSSPIIGKPCKLAKYFDINFVVFPDEESVLEAVKNGAGICNGQKCKECRKCYLTEEEGGWKRGMVIAEVLRLRDKKTLEKIREEYRKQK